MIALHATTEDTISEMHSTCLSIFRITCLLLWICIFIPIYSVIYYAGRINICQHITRYFWMIIRKIMGIRLIIKGQVCREKPMLYVANHSSYLDIAVLGSILDCAFIAKQEVRHWPMLGIIAKVGRTVFIDRKRQNSTKHMNEINGSMSGKNAEALVMFPEGTSNDGNNVLPFKSSLFSVASPDQTSGSQLTVQPVSLAYTKLDGLPIGRNWRPFYAWYGDMELAPHLWIAAGLGNVTVEVEFHPVVNFDMFGSRKALAEHCGKIVRNAVITANSGGQRPESGSIGK